MADNRSPLDLSSDEVIFIYIKNFLGCLAVYLVFKFLWGRYMLTDIGQLGANGTSMITGLQQALPMFLWAAGSTLLFAYFGGGPRLYSPGEILMRGSWISLNAGIFEELIYRWLIFVSAMVSLPFLNFISFGLVKWLYTQLLGPLANWVTLGLLAPQLHADSWVFGAAMLSACGVFRSKHLYMGPLGWINSWFMGMALFYIMFHFGIGTAMVAHILYDLIYFGVTAGCMVLPRPGIRRVH